MAWVSVWPIRYGKVPFVLEGQFRLVWYDLSFALGAVLDYWLNESRLSLWDLGVLSVEFGPALLKDVLNKFIMFRLMPQLVRLLDLHLVLLLLLLQLLPLAFAPALTSALLLLVATFLG